MLRHLLNLSNTPTCPLPKIVVVFRAELCLIFMSLCLVFLWVFSAAVNYNNSNISKIKWNELIIYEANNVQVL